MAGEESTELLTKPLAGRKTANNTKILVLLQYLSMDTVVFVDLKLEVYSVGNYGEFDMFG
jgi:hypothetical protein